MAQFSTGLSDVRSGGVSSETPVVDTTPLAVAQTVGAFANIFAQDQRAKAEAEAQTKEALAVNKFRQEHLKIASLVDDGKLSSHKGRMKLRRLTSDALNANPELGDQILSAHKEMIGVSGLTKVVAEGTAEEQRLAKIEQDAMSIGYVKENMTDEQKAEGLEAFMKRERARADMADIQASLALQSSRVGLSKDKLSLMQAQRKEASMSALKKLSEAHSVKINNDVSEILQQYRSGDVDSNTAEMQLKTLMAEIDDVIGQVGTDAGREFGTHLTAGMRGKLEVALDFIKGKETRDSYENKVNELIKKEQLNQLINNPDMLKIAAGSKLINGFNIELIPEAAGIWQNIFMKNSVDDGRTGDVLDKSPDSALYLRGVNKSLENFAEASPEEKKEAITHVTNIFKSIPQHSSANDAPEEYQEALRFAASPSFGEYMITQGLPPEVASEAKRVIESNYEAIVLPAIQENYSKALAEYESTGEYKDTIIKTAAFKKKEAVSELIKPVFRGGSIVFELDPEAKFRRFTKERHKEFKRENARRIVEKLNRGPAKLINTLVRSTAHLEGHKNYKQIYEELYSKLFSPKPEDEGA